MSNSDRPRKAERVPSFTHEDNGVTFMIVSAAGSAVYTYERAEQEIKLGRRVNIIPTPNAAKWLDIDALHELTGWPIRPTMRTPLVPTFQPPGCRVLASPVSLNTLTKWAQGHADNLAISLLCEATGLGIPTRAEIHLSTAYARHPAAAEAIKFLLNWGVDVSRCRGGADLAT